MITGGISKLSKIIHCQCATLPLLTINNTTSNVFKLENFHHIAIVLL